MSDHHLRVLREFGFVSALRVGARTRYFENGGTHSKESQLFHVLVSTRAAQAVWQEARNRPGVGLAAITATTGLAKSTVKWHLDRMTRMGLLPLPSA